MKNLLNKEKTYLLITGAISIAFIGYAWLASITTKKELYGFQYEIPLIIGGIWLFASSMFVTKKIFGKNWDLSKIYLFSAVSLYGLLLWVQAPTHGMDIDFHYDATYVLTDLVLGEELYEWDFATGNLKGYDRRAEDDLRGLNEKSLIEVYASMQKEMFSNIHSDKNDRVRQDTYQYSVGMPRYFNYPQALGMLVARLSNLNVYWLMFLGRLFICTTCIFITYRAIKNAPFAKDIFFLSSLIPTTMMMTVTVSRDALILAVSFFFISKCLQVTYEEKNRIKDYVTMIFSLILLVPYKMVYFPLFLLLVLILLKKGLLKKIKIKHIIYMVLVLVLGAIAFVAFNYNYIMTYLGSTNVYTVSGEYPFTLTYILNNPGHAIEVFVKTIVFASVRYYANMFATADLGAGLHKEMVVVYSLILIFMVVGLSERDYKERKVVTIKERGIMALTSLFICFMILFAFLVCTPISNEQIIGVQGRYFTPILPLMCLIFWKVPVLSKHRIIDNTKREYLNKYLVYGTYLLSLFVVVNMYVWMVS